MTAHDTAMRLASCQLTPSPHIINKVGAGALVVAAASIGFRFVAGLRRRIINQHQRRISPSGPGESPAHGSFGLMPQQPNTPDQNIEQEEVIFPRGPELDFEMSPESLIVIEKVVQTLKEHSDAHFPDQSSACASPAAISNSKIPGSSSPALPTTPEATESMRSKSWETGAWEEDAAYSPNRHLEIAPEALCDELKSRRELVSAMLDMARHNLRRSGK